MGRGIIAWMPDYPFSVGSRRIEVTPPFTLSYKPDFYACDGCESEAACSVQNIATILDPENNTETAMEWDDLADNQKRFVHAVAMAANECRAVKREVDYRNRFLSQADKSHVLTGQCYVERLFNGDTEFPTVVRVRGTGQTLREYAGAPDNSTLFSDKMLDATN